LTNKKTTGILSAQGTMLCIRLAQPSHSVEKKVQ